MRTKYIGLDIIGEFKLPELYVRELSLYRSKVTFKHQNQKKTYIYLKYSTKCVICRAKYQFHGC